MIILIGTLILASIIYVSKNFLKRRELKDQILALSKEILMQKRNSLKLQAKIIKKNNVKPKITLTSKAENTKIRYLGT